MGRIDSVDRHTPGVPSGTYAHERGIESCPLCAIFDLVAATGAGCSQNGFSIQTVYIWKDFYFLNLKNQNGPAGLQIILGID
jgi:hypothetical protein